MRTLRSPVIGLYFLAPLVAEFFLGDFPLYLLPLILPLSLWYGAGAVLIRELTRRAGRGWPTILLLGLAFGVFEEGVLTMSLFNPDYAGGGLLDKGYLSVLGIGVPWTVFVLGLHVVWSVAVPVALIEECGRDSRTTPWLSTRGLAVVAVLLVAGSAVTFGSNYPLYGHFVATAPQLISSASIAVGLVVLALRLPSGSHLSDGRAPSAWIMFATSLGCGAVFVSGIELPSELLSVSAMSAALIVLGVVVVLGSRQRGWGPKHRFAVSAGLLLTYSWHAFTGGYGDTASEFAVSLVSYCAYAIAAVMLLFVCQKRIFPVTSSSRRSARFP
ncbi:hypothetical protein [Rhodococcoides fascians]|uniref:hypothetical protein n=1 Tax=Rhodococcoides fascians TaxID=1828 RepID=UPI0009B8817B|nr:MULTISPECIES: hypothetical protein [Rhodococcus]OZC50809.1 hypothetical protein CH267_22415 [Rhodococcus sp. 06-621-2]